MIVVYSYLEKLGKWAAKKADTCETLINKDKLRYLNILIVLVLSYCGLMLIAGAMEAMDVDHPIYSRVSDGAVCIDGWRSESTGPGTCSHHGGVDYYVYLKERTGYHYSKPEFYFFQFFIIAGILMLLSMLSRWFLYSVLTFLSVFLWLPFVPFMVVYFMFMIVFFYPISSIIEKIRERKQEKTAANKD